MGRKIPVVFADGTQAHAFIEEVFVLWWCPCGAKTPLAASAVLEPEVACNCGRRFWLVFEKAGGQPVEVRERTGAPGEPPPPS